MGVSYGCEIVSHLVRHQLEMEYSKVMLIKVDVKNAFNEIDPAAIIKVVRDKLPELLPYVLFLLAMSTILARAKPESTR